MTTMNKLIMRFLQDRRSGFSAESRTLQFAGEMRRSADRRYDEKGFLRGLKTTGHFLSFMLAGLVVLVGAGCERQPAGQTAPPPEPTVTFKPQEMADALHAVIAADHETYARLVLQNYPPGGTPGQDENLMALHARMLRQASESVQQQGAEFHYVLRSLWPINPKNAPETDTEKAGLQYVLDHPGTNYYGGESLGGRRYFTAVYAETATVNACADCHNRNPASPKKDFKAGDVMGGLVVRVPLEF
jgi:hypothetical protein